MNPCRCAGTPARPSAVVTVLVLVLLALGAPLTGGAKAAEGPTAKVSQAEAGTGGTVTVTGARWRPRALLTLLICGQNMIGGTNSCANGDGRAVTVGADGTFSKKLPVAEPPKPCPCVIHIATATGEAAAADVAFKVAGHPVAPLPKERSGGERLSVLSARLDGSSGLLTWFGAPPSRRLVVTVGNLGSTPARDPVFEVGTSHGVFAPSWEEQRWRGTIQPGKKAQVKLDVELSAGAHGDYLVSLRYGSKLLVEQPWAVDGPGASRSSGSCCASWPRRRSSGSAWPSWTRYGPVRPGPRHRRPHPRPVHRTGRGERRASGAALVHPRHGAGGTAAPPDFRTVRGDPIDSERNHLRCDEE
ncbi:hypothetical protein SANTM175S_06947 [Streptomyces antimycoticus]